jgi:adenine-specific DNA methylase
MIDKPRLIEVAFPLKQVSIDSVHEKNVRHGHISTLHIWPARRPLAASRAALIATLLPDPGNKEERDELLSRLGGKVKKVFKQKKLPGGRIDTKEVEETEGGILHWGRESDPDLDWFRQKIREAYGGRAPKVLDPFAGGGAIPLEAMRLGCEATAIDINPVAWFILKCTLEYPQKLAGQKRPLPDFVLKDRDFMESYFKAQGYKGKGLKEQLHKLGFDREAEQLDWIGVQAAELEADLAWHVRAWGWWVLQQAKVDLERFYPVVDGKPTVAYLWARTVKCKNCRAIIPLLKTRWLCKKDSKRVVLTMEPNTEKTGVVFGVQEKVPLVGGNSAQKKANDKKVGAGTMSKSGAKCPCCNSFMTMEDIRLEGKAQRIKSVMTAVVVDGNAGKEYRIPTNEELQFAIDAEEAVEKVFAEIPFGLPNEETPAPAGSKQNSSSLRIYGLSEWKDIFSSRQLLAIGTFVKDTRIAHQVMQELYPELWAEALSAELTVGIDKLADYIAALCTWHLTREKMSHVFVRYAFPMNWDFAELNPLSNSSGNYLACIDWVARVAEHTLHAVSQTPKPTVLLQSATTLCQESDGIDLVLTDPPYYDAISYSDIMDFFYVWLRRTLNGFSPDVDAAFREPLAPKWNYEKNDGELIDNPTRFNGDKEKSKEIYEDGMFRVFQACHKALKPEGRLVVVFAHKHPDAWETLVSAIIRAGFVVDGSWPIQTEMGNRTRALSSAALSSSVWLVCKKRPATARPGWDNAVLEEMREKLHGKLDEETKRWLQTSRLRDFWDAGIRGPDFVWAATGPAMEAYSKHPVVKKANEPGQILTVTEFLRHVRRLVLDFVVGRVLSRNGSTQDVSGLDDVTTYYLLHRHDFGMEDAPIGACILYAVSCGLSDTALADQFNILARTGGKSSPDDDDEDADEIVEDIETEVEEGSGSKVKLKPWQQRKHKGMGYEAPAGRPIPLIDQVHRLMHLWKAGDVVKVDDYLDDRALRRNALFQQLLQALIELAPAGNEERAMLESISNHIAGRGIDSELKQIPIPYNPSEAVYE